MSTTPSNNQLYQHESPSRAPKGNEKKLKRDTNIKKKGGSKDHQQNTSTRHPQEKQLLIENFCTKKTSSKCGESTTSGNFLNSNNNKVLFDEQNKKKDETIHKLQAQLKNEQQRSAKARQQYLEMCQKAKQSFLQSKLELAEIKRKHRGQINTKFGHFRDHACTHFIEGQYLTQFKAKIQGFEQSIKDLDSKKSKCAPEEKLLVTSQLQFTKKQLTGLKEELRIREREVSHYKNQLKLHLKSQDCIFAKEAWPLLKNRYQPLYFIGSGGFGQVYSGFDIETYQDIAIKIQDIDTSAQNYEPIVKHLNRQIKIHKQLKHPNIVKMIDQLELSSQRIGLVMEYCTGPELSTYLKREGCLDERQAKHIIKQIIYAVKYLHDQKYSVIHYDLKPANILFHNGIIKIADFGISKVVEGEDSRIDLTSPKIGTYYYLPPEVFQQNNPKISGKVDVWSIGVIFFEMLYGKKPFGHGLSQQKILHSEVILRANHIDFPNKSPKNYTITDMAKDFIRKCLEYDADKRLSSQQAYDHEYIN